MRSHLSLVNQKVSFASATLSLLENATEIGGGNSSLVQKALCESVLLHLYTAFHFYLRELADNNGIKNPAAIDSLPALVAGLNQLGKSPSEVVELQDLVAYQRGWLNSFLMQYERIFKSPAKKVEKKSFGTENFIELIDLTEQQEELLDMALNISSLQHWLNEFKSLVLRQRETGAEY
ncbi:MAG: hypothetical protein B0W54_04580 [Cellvibrio sp. 79]|nr:MAG: hypothetical protein B0W54_04580 [Cellvibrio sp. 79]